MCETLSYYLFTTVSDINNKQNSVIANRDIFYSVMRPMVALTIRRYLENKVCYIPTASDEHSDYIHDVLVTGFAKAGFSYENICFISNQVRDPSEEGQIIIGKAEECRDIFGKVDWSFMLPLMESSYLRSIFHISGSCCIPIPSNSVGWYNKYLDWALNEFYVRAENDYLQVTTEY